MNIPEAFSSCLFETFDKNSRKIFKDWLLNHKGVKKWIISGDFALQDKDRPADCFAFSIIPYNATPQEFASEVEEFLPKDLKERKYLDSKGVCWLRSRRHFHILFEMNRNRVISGAGDNRTQRNIIKEYMQRKLDEIIKLDDVKYSSKIKKIIEETKKNNFGMNLFSDILYLSYLIAFVTIILMRDAEVDLVSWLLDRDDMTSYGEGIIWNFAMNNYLGVAKLMNVETKDVIPIVGGVDKSTGKEVMWFDPYIRAPDWLAGAIAAYNRVENLIRVKPDKYRTLICDVIADSENIIIIIINYEGGVISASRSILTRDASKVTK